MSTAFILIKRNIKLFFKDKGMFFTFDNTGYIACALCNVSGMCIGIVLHLIYLIL